MKRLPRTGLWLLAGLLVSLIVWGAAKPAVAQAEVGPDAVWRPTSTDLDTLQSCVETPDCSPAVVMNVMGAPPAAVEFFLSRPYAEFLVAFEELGPVDLGQIFLPHTNYIGRYEMLNGNPPVVASDSIGFVEMGDIPEYASLLAQYPEATLWPVATTARGETTPGGQRFIFTYPLVDGCHACENLGMGQVAFNFDAAGNYLGVTHLGRIEEQVPPAAPREGPLRQIAYVVPAGAAWLGIGDIWLIDEDGGNRRQLTHSGVDCCLAWSADGAQLYFIRNATTKDSPLDSPTGVIMAYDFATGQERVIATPDVTISDSLALSPDGRSLAFSTSEWTNVEPFGSVHKGCLVIMALDTSEMTTVDCEAPGAIYDITFSPSGAVAVQMGFFEGSRPVFYDTPSSPRRYNDELCCGGFKFTADGSGLYAVGGGYGNPISDIRRYTLPQQDQLILQQTPIEQGTYWDLAPSPAEDRLAYTLNGAIEIMDLAAGAISSLTAGVGPAWRPGDAQAGEPSVAPLVAPLLDRKEATFENLETTTYETSDGVIFPEPIDAFDETAARQLVADLRAADPAAITSGQAAALERLVMQEETLATLLDHYSLLTDDQADVEADLAVMAGGTGLLVAKSATDIRRALYDLARKTVEDFIKLWLNFIDDPALREAAQHGVDDVSLTIDALRYDAPGLAEEFGERALSDRTRAKAAARLIPVLVAAGQPALDQAIRSVRGETPAWPVEGETANAAVQLDGLATQSATISDFAHDTYVDNFGRGREFNEFVKDVGDLLSIASGANPLALLVSFQTRIQQILIDSAAASVLTEAMSCTRDAAAGTGENAFLTAPPAFSCPVPMPRDLRDFFDRLLSDSGGRAGRMSPAAQSLSPELDAALVAYRGALAELRAAIDAADPTAVDAATTELLTAATALNAPAAAALARLDPAAEGHDPTAQMGLGVALTTVRLDAVVVLLATDAYATDPAAADGASLGQILDTATANLDTLGRVAAVVPLPPAPDAARVIVDAPAAWVAAAGRPLAIPVTVTNVGGQPLDGGQLTLELDGQAVAESALPALPPGASAAVSSDFTPATPGRFRLRIMADAGDRPDYRTVDLLITAGADSPASAVAPTEVSDGRLSGEEASSGNDRTRLALLVGGGAGVLFVLGLIAVVGLRRR